MRSGSIAFLLFVVTALAGPLRADVKLPAIFGNHMVLQSGMKVPVWGWADPGETVTVTAANAHASATAGADGKWAATLDNLKASDQPIDVTVAGKNTLTLHDVLVGDVWLCSGQSNMEFALSGSTPRYGGVNNFRVEVAQANHPTLRLFLVEHKTAFAPQTDCTGKWEVCTPATAAGFSAVGYFFARDILEARHVPVGMIGSYWGGSPAQVWTSLQALQAQPQFSGLVSSFETEKAKAGQTAAPKTQPVKPQPAMAKAKARGRFAAFPWIPTTLYNGMIAPLAPYAIKGVIWYQGESNAGNPRQYETLFPALITDWRTRWDQGDFPFIWVQIANFLPRQAKPTQSAGGWPGLRDVQTKTLKLPNTAQAVIIDIGEGGNIHPRDKQDVGRRLALAARHVAYGEDIIYSGPTFHSVRFAGGQAIVKFKNIGTGLTIAAAPATQPGTPPPTPAGQLQGFAIAGRNHKFVWAAAAIDGDTVIVSSPQVKEPRAVRYAWANNPEVNLYNREGLPACPFRSDDWK